MKTKLLIIVLLTSFTINANSQNFSPLSGTVRIGMPLYPWGLCAAAYMGSATLIEQGFKLKSPTAANWLSSNHNFFRFFNMGYDYLIPCWSMDFANSGMELQRPYNGDFENDQYINYVGYFLNWSSRFSRFGFYFGADYEWRRFLISYPPNQYRLPSSNEIHSLVPSIGLRFRLINPEREIEGLPINIVLEAGVSYAVVIKYENKESYNDDVLNNGFRSLVGISIATTKFGSLHVRWSKDIYQLFKNDFIATDGFLYNNEISNDFSCISIGWATFF